MGTQKNLGLSQDAAALLENQTSKGDMVSRLIVGHRARWDAALRHLTGQGWSGAAISAACDILNGVWLLHPYYIQPSFLAVELADGEAINRTASKWGVTPEQWATMLSGIDDETAAAIMAVVVAFWCGDDELERRLRRKEVTP